MITKIGRQVADFEPAVGTAIIQMRLDELLQGLSVPAVPLAVFMGDGVCVIVWMELEKVN